MYIGNNEFFCSLLHFWILCASVKHEYVVGGWYELTIEHVYYREGIADVHAYPSSYDPVPCKKFGAKSYEVSFCFLIGLSRYIEKSVKHFATFDVL